MALFPLLFSLARSFFAPRLELMAEILALRHTRLFLGGVLNWIGLAEPDETVIAGAKTIDQGQLHVRMFEFFGTPILGKRELSLDGIEPDLFVDASHPLKVLRGTIPIRQARTSDATKFDLGDGILQLKRMSNFGVGQIRAPKWPDRIAKITFSAAISVKPSNTSSILALCASLRKGSRRPAALFRLRDGGA